MFGPKVKMKDLESGTYFIYQEYVCLKIRENNQLIVLQLFPTTDAVCVRRTGLIKYDWEALVEPIDLSHVFYEPAAETLL